mmetsp:Transcript_550/g.1483  ORF Transcript_550/g.1483 Transcript_550/m.1483 type:complete len:169 (-) Transcript_550:187-693(-)
MPSKYPILDSLSAVHEPKNLHEAAERGDVNFIRDVIERTVDFDVNQRDHIGRTALHWAAETGQCAAAEMLLGYGCDRTVRETNGRTAVHLAARAADAAMLQILLKGVSKAQGEDLVNETDVHGITPVFLTLQRGDEGRNALEVLFLSGGRYNELPLCHPSVTRPQEDA